jgi:hypothetical protein
MNVNIQLSQKMKKCVTGTAAVAGTNHDSRWPDANRIRLGEFAAIGESRLYN